MTKTKHPHSELLIAFANGETLQYYYHAKWCDWTPSDSHWPDFGAYDWRIKPDLLAEAEDLIVKYTLDHNPNAQLIFSLVERIRNLEKPKTVKVPNRNQLRKYEKDTTRPFDYLSVLQAVYVDAIKACGCEVSI
jgi:hypothetical protein